MTDTTTPTTTVAGPGGSTAPSPSTTPSPAPSHEPPASAGAPTSVALVLVVGGAVGLVAAAILLVEKVAVLTDPTYVPTCSLNPVLSCGSVMTSPQADAFGFPNPVLGLVGFSMVLVTGVALLAGAHLARWYWSALLAGTVLGAAFVHWLVVQSLYRINALCPYCMLVWVVALVLLTTARPACADPVPPHQQAGSVPPEPPCRPGHRMVRRGGDAHPVPVLGLLAHGDLLVRPAPYRSQQVSSRRLVLLVAHRPAATNAPRTCWRLGAGTPPPRRHRSLGHELGEVDVDDLSP
jgi:uncharacterized membrane protein